LRTTPITTGYSKEISDTARNPVLRRPF